jgi:hypothetical protein
MGSYCAMLLKGALLGGIVMFIYLWASWSLIPMHKATTLSFKQETAAASEVMPAVANLAKSAVKAMKSAADSIKPAEAVDYKAMKSQLGAEFLFCLFSALLLTSLLKKACGCPIRFSATVGLLIGAVAYIPNMIWFDAPLNYALLGIADNLIAFTLAGAVISKCLFKVSCTMGKGGEKK